MKPEWDGSPLFQFGDFTLSSGQKSKFKLECDAISPEEWHTLARIARPILPDYGYVIGVPRGGLAWATILQHYVVPGSRRVLVVDDVWTTGGSMMRTVELHNLIPAFDTPWHGLVLFNRGPMPKNVTSLFTLNDNLQ